MTQNDPDSNGNICYTFFLKASLIYQPAVNILGGRPASGKARLQTLVKFGNSGSFTSAPSSDSTASSATWAENIILRTKFRFKWSVFIDSNYCWCENCNEQSFKFSYNCCYSLPRGPPLTQIR